MTNPEFLAAMEALIGPSDFFQYKKEIEEIPDHIRPIVYVAARFGATIETLLHLTERLNVVRSKVEQHKQLYPYGGAAPTTSNYYLTSGEWMCPHWLLHQRITSFNSIQQSCNAAANSMRELGRSFARLRKKLKSRKRFTKRVKKQLPRKKKKALQKLINTL